MNYSVFKHKGFRDLFLGQAVSQIGDALYYISFIFIVGKISGSDTTVGWMGASEVLPFALLSGYAGVMVDRWDRRLVLLYTDLFCGIALLQLSLYSFLRGSISLPSLFVIAILLACARCLFFPAKNAAIPRLVPPDQVTDAFAVSLGLQNVMMMAGTAISAGVLAALWKADKLVFFHSIVLLNATSFLVSAWFVAKMPKVEPQKEAHEEGHTASQQLVSGLNYIWNRKDLVTLMVTTLCFSLAVSPFMVTFNAANNRWFGGTPATLALSEFFFFGGMILGTWGVGKWRQTHPGRAFTCSLAIVGLSVVVMAFGTSFPLFAAANMMCGVAIPFGDVTIRSYLQLSVPDSFRGRVNSIQNSLWTIMMPIGMISAGGSITKFGIQSTFLGMGVLMALTFFVGLLGREFWNAKMPVGDDSKVPNPEFPVLGELDLGVE